MNRPTPHIGQTMQQKRALAHYTQLAAEAEAWRAEQDEKQRIGHELLERIRKHDLSGCAVVEYVPSLRARLMASLRRSFGRWWPVAMAAWVAYVGCGVAATVICWRAWA